MAETFSSFDQDYSSSSGSSSSVDSSSARPPVTQLSDYLAPISAQLSTTHASVTTPTTVFIEDGEQIMASDPHGKCLMAIAEEELAGLGIDGLKSLLDSGAISGDGGGDSSSILNVTTAAEQLHNISGNISAGYGSFGNITSDYFFNASGNSSSSTESSSLTQDLFAKGRNDWLGGTNLTELFAKLSSRSTSSSSSSTGPREYCATEWAGVACWYKTLAGQEAIIPCFDSLNDVLYDTTQNATRMCLSNGTWADRANYDRCKALIPDVKLSEHYLEVENAYASNILYVGYGLSMFTLMIALWIFCNFKDLRCVRNTIHSNLMATYLLNGILWMVTHRLHVNGSIASRQASCYIHIGLTYLLGTNFFWMFVEGLYLYILVVKTFSIEFIRTANYIFIGWGLPAVVILVWSLTKVYFTPIVDIPVHKSKLMQEAQLEMSCPWQANNEFDYIYKVPILIVLIINIFFLGKIMWVLIIKLRTVQNSAESKQYRKAAKALLVLIPLLGVGYMLVLVTPTHPTARLIFKCLQAGLVSTQGFTVAVLYCFYNGEVRNSLSNHFARFQMRRTLRHGRDYPKAKGYYKSTAGYHSYHHNNSRASYGFQSLNSESGGNRTLTNSSGGSGGLNHPMNNNNRRTSGNGGGGGGGGFSMNGDTPSRAARFSNASDSAATVRLYRANGRGGEKGRGDSCVSFTTTSSYVVLSGGGSGTGTSVATSVLANGNANGNGSIGGGTSPPNVPGTEVSVVIPSSGGGGGTINGNGNSVVVPGGSIHNNSNGYHSIPSTPDDEDRIDIELQPI